MRGLACEISPLYPISNQNDVLNRNRSDHDRL